MISNVILSSQKQYDTVRGISSSYENLFGQKTIRNWLTLVQKLFYTSKEFENHR